MGSSLARAAKRLRVLGATLFILSILGAPVAAECRPDQIDLRWDGGSARFSVEVADDDAERGRGLMFRDSMPQSSGMLFVYPSPRRATFWMKNTLIPLDMIFADQAGRVTRIHENAVPEDTTVIDGGGGVQFVLEINGGLARRMGITEGAEMRHPLIAESSWQCSAE